MATSHISWCSPKWCSTDWVPQHTREACAVATSPRIMKAFISRFVNLAPLQNQASFLVLKKIMHIYQTLSGSREGETAGSSLPLPI